MVEWGSYLDAMAKEYVTEVARVEGSDPSAAIALLEASKLGSDKSKGGHWLDKEKQEQLVRDRWVQGVP